MTDIVTPPTVPDIPAFPSLGETGFNVKAAAWADGVENFSTVLQDVTDNVHDNATAAHERATAAESSKNAAAESASAAATSATQAGQYLAVLPSGTLNDSIYTSTNCWSAVKTRAVMRSTDIVPVAALDIDCNAGNYFTKTINGNSTFTFSNPPSGVAFAITLELTHTSGVVTWPTSVKWPDNMPPTLVPGKVSLMTFVTDDGGARWRGLANTGYDA